MTTKTELLERIGHLGGLDPSREAPRALKATLAALGERLSDELLGMLAGVLPDELGAVLLEHKAHGGFDVAELFDRVAKREGVTVGFAREHAQVVCRAIGEILPEGGLKRLVGELPDSFVDLFRPPPSHEPPPEHPVVRMERAHTLATGKPGAEHPLSQSRPHTAQSHSVAREKNPHADTKLSSAIGMTQERLDESMATARPASRRTIGTEPD